MDDMDIADPNPIVTITAPAPFPNQDCFAVMAGVDEDAFMDEFADAEAFYASSAKEKVLVDLQAATTSTHNLVKTLNLLSTNGYHLDTDASDALVTELLQAVYTVSKFGLVQHAVTAGSKAKTIALCILIKSHCTHAPLASVPTPQPQPSGSRPPMLCSSNATSDPTSLCCLVTNLSVPQAWK
jgi:hypothetical protein